MPTDYAIKNGRTAMNATLYTGTGATLAVSNADKGTLGFKPDFVWEKNRTGTNYHALFDSVRGRAYGFATNSSDVQSTSSAGNDFVSFDATGFTVGPNQNWGGLNSGSDVAWQWQAGQGTTSNNTSGTITSTVSANTTAGFSVVQFTSPTTGNTGTVGHGLGAAPDFIMYREYAITGDTIVYHSAVGATKYLDMTDSIAAATNANVWNNTAPTASVFSIGTSFSGSHATIAYCWKAVPGFSAFGSYTGNGNADGPFIYTGFRPRFILLKSSSNVSSWLIEDTARAPYNVVSVSLWPNSSAVEYTTTSDIGVDILSNGIKIRSVGGETNYYTGGTYIYAAFAENPFKYANAR